MAQACVYDSCSEELRRDWMQRESSMTKYRQYGRYLLGHSEGCSIMTSGCVAYILHMYLELSGELTYLRFGTPNHSLLRRPALTRMHWPGQSKNSFRPLQVSEMEPTTSLFKKASTANGLSFPGCAVRPYDCPLTPDSCPGSPFPVPLGCKPSLGGRI